MASTIQRYKHNTSFCIGQERGLAGRDTPTTKSTLQKQLSSQPEQKYDLELSFPVDSVLATNVNDDRRARIDNLIQEILLATQVSFSAGFDFVLFSISGKGHFLETFLLKEKLE